MVCVSRASLRRYISRISCTTVPQYCTIARQFRLTCVKREEWWNGSCLLRIISGCSNYLKMLLRQFIHSVQLRVTKRCFTRNSIIREIDKADKISAQNNKTVKEKDVKDQVIGSRMHRVSNFDKRILVWVKRYPSIADVPRDVTVDCILAARSKARIKTCNYMIVATILGCLAAVILGKRDAERGEHLWKQRDDWLKERLAEDKNK